jgi:hydrogenase expression/formation protein HypC
MPFINKCFAPTIIEVTMCLAIPTKIISIDNDMAQVEIGGVTRKASIQLVPEAKVGDYILLHAGFAIEVLDEDEALETLNLLEQIGEIS